MRKILLSLVFVLALMENLPSNRTSAAGQSGVLAGTEPDSGSVVCPPGIYGVAPDGCLALGPSETLAQNAAIGIPYPILPLPAYKPDAAYNDLPYRYFKINENGTPFYASLDDAIANQPSGPHMYPSKHLYVSYQEMVSTNGDIFYLLRNSFWIRALGGRLGRFDPPFQGFLFSSPPRNAFGWVLGETESHIAPGTGSPKSGITHHRFEVVQIFATENADNLKWNLIAPGEWVDSRQVARVDPSTSVPNGVTGGRWIEVNLYEQTVAVYDQDRLVFATMASTGVERFWTRPGLFKIRIKLETETMRNNIPDDFYYLEDVPWTMYFDEERALHGAYWLYDWAAVGDFVYVIDPSNQTPTDPSLYGTGSP
jgi:hypothetical protein